MLKSMISIFYGTFYGAQDSHQVQSPTATLPVSSISDQKKPSSFDPKLALPSNKVFPVQNTAVMGKVLEFLPKSQSVELAAKSKFFAHSLRLYQDKIETAHLLSILFQAINCGDERKVSELLDKVEGYHRALNDLLIAKIDFIDHSGRIFHNITALQYAIWNQDISMQKLLCNYMEEKEVSGQIYEHDTNGIDYSMPLSDFQRLFKILPEHLPPVKDDLKRRKLIEALKTKDVENQYILLNEKHYDWCYHILQAAEKAHFEAYKRYMSFLRTTWAEFIDEDFSLQAHRSLLTLGFVQRYLTVPWVNAFCSSRYYINSKHQFSIENPNRITTFESNSWSKNENYFEVIKNERLGSSFGLVKFGDGKCYAAGEEYFTFSENIFLDNTAFHDKFFNTRVQYFVSLSKSMNLQNIAPCQP